MESAIARLEGREFEYLMKKKRITIGRSSGVDINMGPSRFISRKHLDVLMDSGVFYLVCRGKNGIFVDDIFQGREAKRTQLPLSCVIRFPSTQIKLAFTSLVDAPATPSPVMTPPPIFPLKLDTLRSPFVSPFVSPAPSPTGTISAVNSCPASPSGKVPSFDVMVRYASSLLSNQPSHPVVTEEEVDANNHPAVIGIADHEVSHDDARGSHDEAKESHDDTMEDRDSDDEVDGGADKKPPYSYAQLIVQALLSAADHKQTLSGIYEFISKNYPFYKIEDKGWKNSIRHNLSLNQYFTKAPRQPMAGKGGYWSMHPDFEEKLVAQAYTKRKKKGIPVFPANSLISKSAPSSPTHHAGMTSHDFGIGRDSPQPHPSRSMVMLPAPYSLPSSPSRNHRPLKFTHLTLGASTGSLQRVDTGEDPPASKKLCLDPSVPNEDGVHHTRPGKLFGTSSTALLTAMHRSMATRETPTMPNINLGSKLKDIQQQPVAMTTNGSFKSSTAVQMVPISLVSSSQGHVYVNIPSGVFSQSQQPSVTAAMSTQALLAPQAFIPMATIQQDSPNGSHDLDKESCDDEVTSTKEQECDDAASHDATIPSPTASNGSPDASVGSPDALPGSPDSANAD